MNRSTMALAFVLACGKQGVGDDADDSSDIVDTDTVGADTDGAAADTVADDPPAADTTDDDTDSLAGSDTVGDTDSVRVDSDTMIGDSNPGGTETDTVGVDTDTVPVDPDTVELDTDMVEVDTNIDPADVNDTVDYGGDIFGAEYDGLCELRQPGDFWIPDTNSMSFGEYFGESLLRYGITERSVLALGGSPTWIYIPAEDAENLPYDPRHAAAPLTLPLVPGEYAIEMQVHRNGRDATWHRPGVFFNNCVPRDPGWVNLDLHYQTWVTIVAEPDTGSVELHAY